MASVADALASGGIAAAGCHDDLANEDRAVTLKEAGIEVKAAGGHGLDFAKEMDKLMEKPANKEEAVKAVNAD